MHKTIILGGGASGLFLASMIKDYVIIEHNKEIGAKLKISGGGKCNITNKKVSFENYNPSHQLIKKTLNNQELLKWLKKRDIKTYEIKKNQLFLKDAKILVNKLKNEIKNISLNTTIISVKKEDNLFIVKTNKGVFKSKNLVIALGGVSFANLGATDLGYNIAKQFNHTITPLKPALVGLTVQKSEFWFKELSGISILADVKINNKNFRQNILFSHRGITGPAILNASLYWEKGDIEIDFLAGKNIYSLLKNKEKIISTQLPLPKRFAKLFLTQLNIEDKKVKFLSKKELEKLALFNSYKFSPAGTFGFKRAEITKGGVCLDEVNEYFESKFVKNLFFIGEVLNANGELGGYNLLFAFSSAYKAAKKINSAPHSNKDL